MSTGKRERESERHLEKFNLINDETQEMKKQQTTIEKFFDRL